MARPARPAAGVPALPRALGFLHATAIVAGTMIGASIFVQPSEITGQVPSAAGVYLVWTIAGLLTLAGALVCAELASAYPATGGVYVFLRETLSPAVAFLWGWAMFWSVHSGIVAAIAIVLARYAGHFVPVDAGGERAMATAAIAGLSLVNIAGVRLGGGLQAVLTAIKVAAIGTLIAAAFLLGPRAPESTAANRAAAGELSAGAIVAALIAGLFAYGGWHLVTYTAGETREAARTVPRALAAGTLLVTACYLGLNAAYLHVLPLEAVIASPRVAADAAQAIVGAGGASVMAALVVVSALGALNGVILAGPRVYYQMAADRLAPAWLGAVHPRLRTPHHALAAQAVWAAALVWLGTYRALFTRVIYTEWIFFGLMAVGLLAARRRAGYAPAFRVPLGPIVPAAFIAACALIAAVRLVDAPAESAVGLLVVALGLPVYHLRRARRRLP